MVLSPEALVRLQVAPGLLPGRRLWEVERGWGRGSRFTGHTVSWICELIQKPVFPQVVMVPSQGYAEETREERGEGGRGGGNAGP